MTVDPPRDAVVTIDLGAYRRNIAAIAAFAGSGTRLMAVVKSNAYGHGMIACARAALSAGASMLGVAHAWEGTALRDDGINAPILVMGAQHQDAVPAMIVRRLAVSLTSPDMLDAIAGETSRAGLPAIVHVKVDTGMGRLGLDPGDVPGLIERARTVPGLTVEGIFSHLASADSADGTFTRRQIAVFAALLDTLSHAGLRPPVAHLCNSAGLVKFPDARLDMVRAGIMSYGIPPFAGSNAILPVEPVLRWTTRVAYIHHVLAGYPVSYGSTFVTTRPSRLAVIPVGYADGLRRHLSNRGHALAGGICAPFVGTMCMNQSVLDITDAGAVAVGDEVVLLGSQNGHTVTPDDHALIAGTISYDIVTGIADHIPRTCIQSA